jgi:hypothetical protein
MDETPELSKKAARSVRAHKKGGEKAPSGGKP